MSEQLATFGAGCFWGIESIFRDVPGVIEATSGYMGGSLDNPSYRDVCSDRSGHAEVVQVKYDPAKVSFQHLLRVFWEHHDPTTLNRQGPDYGTQYRSVIFFHSPEQETAARESKETLEQARVFRNPIVTYIEPGPTFWRAEEYHQRYFEKQGVACHIGPPAARPGAIAAALGSAV